MVINLALLCLVVSTVLALRRVIQGPSWGDRLTAFDFLSVNLALLIVVFALRTGFISLLDIALLISILGFVSTVALARHLLKGRVL